MLGKRRALQEQRDQLQHQLQLLTDKQRMYTKTVVEFQQVTNKSRIENGYITYYDTVP